MRIATTDGAHKLPDKVQRGGERGRGRDKGSGRAGDRSEGSQACPGWSNSMQMAKTSCKCKQVRGQQNHNALLRTDAASCKCNNSEATSQVGSTECQACYSHRYSPCIHSTNHYAFAIFTFVLRCLFTSFLFFSFLFFVFVYMFIHLTLL